MANSDIAGMMNRLGGVYRGNHTQASVARRKAQSFAGRKRFDLARRAQMVADSRVRRVGKSDSWGVPDYDIRPVAYRGRANYRTGTAGVGKRMTGVVTGVGTPKRVQPGRAAARKVAGAGMPTSAKPPIDFNLVGKRDRRYNPEAARQRRQAGYATATGLSGAALAGSGVRDARRSTLALRGLGDRLSALNEPGSEIRFATRHTKATVAAEGKGRAGGFRTARGATPDEVKMISALSAKKNRPVVLGARHAGKIGAGAGLLAASGALVHHSRNRANREWR